MYDSYMSVNKKFKSSVNLQYDLYNEEKILQYVPTTDLCDVISYYVDSVIGNGQKSTFLAGPYGKGKSYLMLIITYLLSKRENKEMFKKVVNKISKINKDLARKIEFLEKNKISLLPVIISNNNSDDLNHNFLLSLRNALLDHGIQNIIPNSAYSEAIDIVNEWEKQNNSSFDIFKECKTSLDIDFNKLKEGLLKFEEEAFENFKKLFKCVNHGYQYNSLISSDFSLTYMDISKRIKEYGFSGIFVIYDEFGVLLENQGQDFVSKLNKIQSFAEKCETSEIESQMHFCCITHKEITLYGAYGSYLDSFEKIVGRFKQIRFDRSMEENYQIICTAIEKNKEYQSLVSIELETNKYLERYGKSSLFNKNQLEYIFNNGFPFNPFALYALIQVSEKVAQNERTLFTFMSDTDVNSFNYFIANNNIGLLNVPAIYDYFEPLIKDNIEYRMLCYKVDNLNKTILKSQERDVIKCVAISKIINDNIKYASSDENIALALDKNDSEVKKIIKSLINANVLKRNINDDSVDFSVITDNQFLTLLDDTFNSKYGYESVSKLLNEFNEEKYFVSNQYNYENKMVRYFRAEYIEASVLENLNTLDVYFSQEFSDGLIINLINDTGITQKRAREILENLRYKNVIIRFTDKMIPVFAIKKIRRLFAAKNLLLDSSALSEDAKNALPKYVDDELIEINSFLREFTSKYKILSLEDPENKSLSAYIYQSLSSLYEKTVVINNEQVNKNEISSVTNKARINVIELILNKKECEYSTTSAEGTIYDSFASSINNNYEIIDEIKSWFLNNNNDKLELNSLVRKLSSAPYGMRDGVIPLYVAKAISDLLVINNDVIKTIILYNRDLEIPMNAINLCKALAYSDQYNISFAEINHDKILMINDLMSLFNCKAADNFSDNVLNLMNAIKNYIQNLPPIIIKTSKSENILNLSITSIKFKDEFLKQNLNIHESLLIKLPKLLASSIKEVSKNIKNILEEYDKNLNKYYQEIIVKVINAFGSEMDSIKSTYDLWKAQYSQTKNVIFENREKVLYKAFEAIKYNNKDALNLLSYALFNCTVDDWNSQRETEFISVLRSFIDRVYNYDENSIAKQDFNDNKAMIEISQLGKTLYSNLTEMIEEYGSALSNEEKASIIKRILNDLID